MDPHTARWMLRTLVLSLGAFALYGLFSPVARAGLRHQTNPAQVVPLDQIAPEYRAAVFEVIRDHTFHRQGKADTFPCHPRIYLALLNEPALTLALWQDLSNHPAKLKRVSPNRYYGTDGSGAAATWEFVLRTPQLHVLLCDLEYATPRGNARLTGRIVLLVRSGYFKEVSGDPWVQHDIEAFVKIDSKGWKAVATTVRPIIERVLEEQVQEAGWFVSLMGRLVASYPNWAIKVVANQEEIPLTTRHDFQNLIARTRRPGALDGRPALAENTDPKVQTR